MNVCYSVGIIEVTLAESAKKDQPFLRVPFFPRTFQPSIFIEREIDQMRKCETCCVIRWKLKSRRAE